MRLRLVGRPGQLAATLAAICVCSMSASSACAETFSSSYTSIAVGRDRGAAAREPAARTWFGPFNSATATVEWRAAGGTPFAVIQRWRISDIDDEDKTGRPISKQMLVVTRLPPGAVCHVAYVDVKANSNANELARQAADTMVTAASR